MVKKSVDGKVKFYDKAHKYKESATGKELHSVTRLIHSHFPSFDEKAMARMLAGFAWAKKQKKGVRYWLSEWKKNREEGSLCHEEMEKYLLDPRGSEVLFDVYNPRSLSGVSFLKDFLPQYSSYEVIPEMIVYDDNLAGQSDLILNKNNNVVIVDWKFTKRIKREAYNKEQGTGTSKLTSHLVNCNYNTYSLQLSIYAYLLEKKGYNPERLVLVHIDPDGKVVPYEIDYLRSTAKSIVEGFKNE